MLEEVAKNLWLLLTVVIPGLFTYGAWRLLLLLEPSKSLDSAAFEQLDDSAIASASVVIAIALFQQAFAIAIEACLTFVAKQRKNQWPHFYALFCERFALSAAGKLTENATRIIGNFFLSINISVGLLLLLVFFLAYEKSSATDWIPVGVGLLLGAAVISAIFRMLNAMWVIAGCKTAPESAHPKTPKHSIS